MQKQAKTINVRKKTVKKRYTYRGHNDSRSSHNQSGTYIGIGLHPFHDKFLHFYKGKNYKVLLYLEKHQKHLVNILLKGKVIIH